MARNWCFKRSVSTNYSEGNLEAEKPSGRESRHRVTHHQVTSSGKPSPIPKRTEYLLYSLRATCTKLILDWVGFVSVFLNTCIFFSKLHEELCLSYSIYKPPSMIDHYLIRPDRTDFMMVASVLSDTYSFWPTNSDFAFLPRAKSLVLSIIETWLLFSILPLLFLFNLCNKSIFWECSYEQS